MATTTVTPVTLIQTCNACPSQWEGKLSDGRMFYIRYRWGHLRVETSVEPSDKVEDAIFGDTIFDAQIGDGLDGFMDTTDMVEITKNCMNWGKHGNG